MVDTISVSDLQVHLANGLGPSAFGLTAAPPCPISLTLDMHLEEGITSADEDTMLGLGVNYSSVSKQVYALLSDRSRTFASPAELASAAAAIPLGLAAVTSVDVSLRLPKALLHAQSALYETEISRQGIAGRMSVECMQVACVIGLHPHEKAERQRLEVDMRISPWDDKIGLRRIADVGFSVSTPLSK
jgi:dihydroneopterin aldolase/2-amino-4-hydroxy-6-hydroxymethyldihydropteridine diphosphokinase/dihydropteroate synthase